MLTFKEYIMDWLIEQNIFEQAFDRKELSKKLRGIQIEFASHFCMYACANTEQYLNHWKVELKTFYQTIRKSKSTMNQKRLRYEDYFKFLYIEPLCHIDGVKQMIEADIDDDYNCFDMKSIDFGSVQHNIKAMYMELCRNMSNDVFLPIETYLHMIRKNIDGDM